MTVTLCSYRNEAEVKADLAAMAKASKQINASQKKARAFLLKHGFITKTNKLAKRYR